jgi:hypothetical protein
VNREPIIKEADKNRTVNWRYVWVKTPNISSKLPSIFTKKWVRVVTQMEVGASAHGADANSPDS